MEKLRFSYADYNKLVDEKYTISEIKSRMRPYKPKKTRKHEIIHECYTYLKQSFFVNKIKLIWRNYLVHKFNHTHGPAIHKRSLCNNTEDFLTTETMTEIDYKYFISYKDNNNFIYGFNIISISTLLDKHNTNNPYTMEPFPDEFVNTVNRRKLYNKLFGYNNETTEDAKQSTDSKFLSIFQRLDSLGNYTQLEWITQLNNKKLRKFICELYDIWMYRSQLTSEIRYQLCPPFGNPFRNIPMHLFHNRNIHIENITLKEYIFNICDSMVNNIHSNDEKKSLCAIYILTAFTLVHKGAAESLPWLYQSVI